MSDTKHTPGPLHVATCPKHADDPTFRCAAIRTDNGEKVEHTLANLWLWAAAPDLLEFARNYLLSQDECVRGDGSCTTDDQCAVCALNEEASAAIAKATAPVSSPGSGGAGKDGEP